MSIIEKIKAIKIEQNKAQYNFDGQIPKISALSYQKMLINMNF